MYKVTITNHTDKTIQLLRRHWDICDANGNVQIIEGEGVIGEQPIINPDSSFQYNSFSPLKTELLLQAEKLHFITVGGLGMLLYQACPAFKMWYGKSVKIDRELKKKVLEQL